MLSGDQLQRLEHAMLDAYQDRRELDRLLFYSLDRRLSDYVGEQGMTVVVFELIKAAKAGNWLEILIDQVISNRAGNAALRGWAAECGWQGLSVPQAAPPADQQMLDSAFFDLLVLKRRVQQAKEEDQRRVLGFGLHDTDMLVVNKLCSWLPYCLGETERKEWLSLRPELATVDVRIKQVLRYLPDLEYVNVLCPILTDGAPASVVAAFWNGLRQHFGLHKHRFVALFAGGIAPDHYPADVVRLPSPSVDRTDLSIWAQEIVSRRGWPAELAESWSSLIVEQCSTGTELDIRLLFEAMDSSIRKVRQSPDDFRRHLKELSSRA